MAKKVPSHGISAVRHPDPGGKKIEYEERRNRLQKTLEKRRAESSNQPKDTPNNSEDGKKPDENSK